MRDTFLDLLQDEKLTQKQRWGLSFLNNDNGTIKQDSVDDDSSTAAVAVNDLSDSTHLGSLSNSIRGFSVTGGTPTTQRYYEVSSALRQRTGVFENAIQYRCQPNFIVLLTDGVTNGQPFAVSNDPFVTNYRLPNGINYSQWSSRWFEGSGWTGSWTGNQNKDDGLAFLSENLATNDILTGGSDKEGISWDDSTHLDFQKQTIKTLTVAFGRDVVSSATAKAYLENGASYMSKLQRRGYFEAEDKAALKRALQTALDLAGGNEGYASVAPAVVASQVPQTAIVATLNTKNWSSELHFLKLKREGDKSVVVYKTDTNGQPVLDGNNRPVPDYVLPSYGSLTNNASSSGSTRRVVVTTPSTAPHFLTAADAPAALFGLDEQLKLDTLAAKQSYIDWLIRNSSKTDTQINSKLRERSLKNEADRKPSDPDRQMGDITGGSILLLDDDVGGRVAGDSRPKFLITGANDGMLHVYRTTAYTDRNTNPYELKFNYLPGSARRQLADDTAWARVGDTANPDYGKNEYHPHHYLMNGGISYIRTSRENCPIKEGAGCTYGSGQLIVVGALGQGGKGVYGLNLGGRSHVDNAVIGLSQDNQDQWLNVPAWESASNQFGANKADSNNYTQSMMLGYTVGKPVIAPLATKRDQDGKAIVDADNPKRYAAFVANGYYGADSSPTLYVYDAAGISSWRDLSGSPGSNAAKASASANNAGKLIRKISVGGSNSALGRNGLSSPAVVDLDMNGSVDLVYAGDYHGNMYRFDLRHPDPSSWTVSRIYAGSSDQPITAAPSVYRKNNSNKLVVAFGTGSDLYTDDLYEVKNNVSGDPVKVANTKNQAFYGIFDTVSEESNLLAPLAAKEVQFQNRDTQLTKQAITEDNKSLTLEGEAKTVRILTNNKVPETGNGSMGWYVQLSTNTGERVTVQPEVIANSVFFTTRQYTFKDEGKVCSIESSSGSGWVWGVNAETGGNLSAYTANFNPLTDRRRDGAIYFSAYAVEGIPSATNFLANNSASLIPNIYQVSGQVKDGEEKPIPPELICRRGSGGAGELMYTTSTGKWESTGIACPLTNTGVKRLSWREIF
ncbi:pilus assembly protein [Paralysiella testudinis]|uniref:PilY1 beta-propeller domain-containing protein n=1 Tax=Paralysiella testudinis TaxID=2809020 RepID=A0A892ZQA0_9NEIS|nr:PilC/PilY family type IV pilus protein [Paralysiella testudinis]QRQ82979.1 hypothetical protein JQU52_06295 [Paralysiella testudinis]